MTAACHQPFRRPARPAGRISGQAAGSARAAARARPGGLGLPDLAGARAGSARFTVRAGCCGLSAVRAGSRPRASAPGLLAGCWRPPARPGEGRERPAIRRAAAARCGSGRRSGRREGQAVNAAGNARARGIGSPGRIWRPGARAVRAAAGIWSAAGSPGRRCGLLAGLLRPPGSRAGSPGTPGKEKPRHGGRGLWGDLAGSVTGRARRRGDRPA